MSGSSRGRAIRWLGALGRAGRAVGKRVYALALIGLIGYSSFLAFRYLVYTLMLPAEAPAQVTQLPRRLDRRVLETDRAAWAGLRTAEHARAPLSHYHRLDTWIQPDRANNCTTSGCHPPLPHAERKEVRAFLNMHATSLHCGVCHMQTEEQPLNLTWYDPATGASRGVPAVLETYAKLLSIEDQPGGYDEDARRVLVDLLRRAAVEAQDGEILTTLADHLRRLSPEAVETADFLAGARAVLPRYFRGEYGAKLALRGADTEAPILAHPGVEREIEPYRAAAGAMTDAERKNLVDRLHPLRRTEALECSDCHADGGIVDFAAAGYPPQRVRELTGSIVARMIQHISDGSPFYLPEFLTAPGTGEPERGEGSSP
ncbi:MAG: hypothetical protein BroJett003_24730 [Planctomycetota bacterium]|nr:MAG: hypothetical protein BroJett003_24730 [Planctomycetota bacterium]